MARRKLGKNAKRPLRMDKELLRKLRPWSPLKSLHSLKRFKGTMTGITGNEYMLLFLQHL